MLISITILSSIAFIIYGFLCLTTDHMTEEFERYQLQRFRRLTGILELLGGIGLLVGLKYPAIHAIAALGLTLLMSMGIIVRAKVKDPILEIIPAGILMIINATIIYLLFNE